MFFRSSTLCFLLSYIYLETGVIWVVQCMYGDWRTDDLRESVFSFHHAGLENQTQVTTHGSKCLCLLSHFTGPTVVLETRPLTGLH